LFRRCYYDVDGDVRNINPIDRLRQVAPPTTGLRDGNDVDINRGLTPDNVIECMLKRTKKLDDDVAIHKIGDPNRGAGRQDSQRVRRLT